MEDLPLAELLRDHKNLGRGCKTNCKAGKKLYELMHTPTDSYDFYMVSSWLQQPGLSSREHKAVTLKAAIFCYQGAIKVTFKLERTS